MNEFLLKLLELSLQAGALTIGILIVRLTFRKLPAKYLCILWMIVAARLVIPFSIESSFAPMGRVDRLLSENLPMQNTASGADYNKETDYFVGNEQGNWSEEGIVQPEVDISGTNSRNEADTYEPGITKNHEGITVFETEPAFDWKDVLKLWVPVLFALWLVGVVMLLGYGAISCKKVSKLVKSVIPYKDNIWLCDGLESPFLFGWIHPQIYLPTNLEETQMQYVIEHEKSHIARKDHVTKLIGYTLLSVYWFNPLIWVAYVMFCKDVERACDERVIAGFGAEDKKGYAEALLLCSVDQRFAILGPLAFGETDVKKRIGGVLNYRKPGRWLAAIAVLLCVIAVAGCFFVQKEDSEDTNLPGITPTATPSPTPTSAVVPPVAEPTVTPTPTEAVSKLTPTPLPPSDLELLGNVTQETVLAVPMGQTVEMDLDGDGTKDVITCGYEGFGKGEIFEKLTGGSWRLSEALFQLNINGRTFRDNEIREEYWNDGPGFTTYYIFDVNTEDKYKEIGLYFDGPSGDPSTALYRYVDGKLYCVGVFESATLESDYSWNSDDYEDVPYEEMVQAVDRTSFCISVPGDGTIFCEERTSFFETTAIVREYKLWNSSMGKAALLQETIRDRYEFTGWQTDREILNVRAVRNFTAYLSPVDITKEERKDTVTVTIPEGTRISFYAYYPDNEWTAGWVQFAYGENLEHFAWLYKGVDVTGKFMIYLPDETENDVDALFENLSRAG